MLLGHLLILNLDLSNDLLGVSFPAMLENIIARAIQQGLAQGLQQGFMTSLQHHAATPSQLQPPQEAFSDLEQTETPEPSDYGSISEEEETRDLGPGSFR